MVLALQVLTQKEDGLEVKTQSRYLSLHPTGCHPASPMLVEPKKDNSRYQRMEDKSSKNTAPCHFIKILGVTCSETLQDIPSQAKDRLLIFGFPSS